MAANNRARVCTIPITPSFCLTLATVLSPLQSRLQSLLCVSVCTTYAGRKTADEPCHRRCDFRFSYITIDSHGAPCSERARNPRLMSTNGKRNGWLVENQTTKEYRWHERTRPEICSFRVFSLSLFLFSQLFPSHNTMDTYQHRVLHATGRRCFREIHFVRCREYWWNGVWGIN